MISADQWRAYNEAVAKITDAARTATEKQLAEWMAEHAGATVAEARKEAQRILAANAELYSQQAAALAAEWYDAQGKAAGMRLDRAVTSVTVDRDSLSKTVHYQAQKLADGDSEGFCAAAGEWAENEAKRALNATVMANVGRDKKKGVKFARVTSGRNACGFCLMLAGRGAVYHTRQSAGEMNRYHRHCSCKIVPGYTGNKYEVLVEGHDPKKIENRLIEVENQTGTVRGTADFNREVSLRDPDWLLGDIASFPSYSDEKTGVKKKEDKDHPAELRTAYRLSKNGFSTVFVDDEIPGPDGEGGRSRVIGLPDLESGLEIKNVSTARSENTISKHIGRTKRKRGFTALAIDISENPYLSDEVAQAMISNSLRRHGVKSAYMVGHDERVVLVKAK